MKQERMKPKSMLCWPACCLVIFCVRWSCLTEEGIGSLDSYPVEEWEVSWAASVFCILSLKVSTT